VTVTRLFRLFPILAAVLLVTGCYLPNDFTADLRITPDGNYRFTYDGKLTYLPLLDKLKKGELSQQESAAQVKTVEQDLARDSAFEQITYVGQATFIVRYKRIGNILREKSFTFVRLNSRLLTLERRQDGTIGIFGDKPNTEDAKRIAAIGIVMRGMLRIQTEAEVRSSNATEVVRVAPPVYIWHIEGVEKASPGMVLVVRP
jgi:hypothetical protein